MENMNNKDNEESSPSFKEVEGKEYKITEDVLVKIVEIINDEGWLNNTFRLLHKVQHPFERSQQIKRAVEILQKALSLSSQVNKEVDKEVKSESNFNCECGWSGKYLEMKHADNEHGDYSDYCPKCGDVLESNGKYYGLSNPLSSERKVLEDKDDDIRI